MTHARSRSGAEPLVDLALGTHRCHFYEDPDELVASTVSLFEARLRQRDACIWLLPDAVEPQAAWAALRARISDLDPDAIEVMPNRAWYLRHGRFEPERVIRAWDECTTRALERGYRGLCAVGGPTWLSDSDWPLFTAYERELDADFSAKPMSALCVYPLAQCSAAHVLDLADCHQLASAQRGGRWQALEVPRGDPWHGRRSSQTPITDDRRFHALFDQAPVGISLFEPNGKRYEINRCLEQMLGYSADDFSEASIENLTERLLHPDDLPLALGLFAELLAGTRTHYRVELRWIRKNGEVLWGNLTVALVNDGTHAPLAVSVIEDMTEQRRVEEALRKAQSELAHAGRVMAAGEMAASIAHEVNQPLAAIRTNAGAALRWLARETPELAEAQSALASVIDDSHRASEVIARVHELVRRTEPHYALIAVDHVICEVVALAQGELRKHRVQLRTELAAPEPVVLGDRIQLQQVVLNLIMNAIEAISAAGPDSVEHPRELLLRSGYGASGSVLVEVCDTGVGFDPTLANRIFDAFFTTKPDGMGMGLSISRSIIESHAGRLWATPNPGLGATFHFTLPLADIKAGS